MNIKFKLDRKGILIFTFIIQLATFGLIGLDKLEIDLFLLRQLILFIYLTFVPGILIIGALKLLNKLSITEIVLYSVGLSNSFLMIIGLIINNIYPIFGISKPISELPLIVTISVCNLVLWWVYFIRGEFFTKWLEIELRKFNLIILIIVLLLPTLSILGTYFLTWYSSNIILLFMLAIISIIPLLAILKFPEDFYPVILWTISISLLFQTSLVSTVVPNGGDATCEYYISKFVLNNGIWDPCGLSNDVSLLNNINSMLRIAILHPIFSILLKISLIWEYKIIHPLIFSLTPVALYLVYKKQTTNKIGFLSSCLFMFLFPFFTTLAMNTRTGMAIFYITLILLLMVDNKISRPSKVVLYVLFLFSIITSHYGTGWLFMLALLFTYILVVSVIPLIKIIIFKNYYYLNINNNEWKFSKFLSLKLVMIYFIMAIAWYLYTSRGSVFNNFTNLMYVILKNALTNLRFDVKTSYTTLAIMKEWVPTIEVIKFLFLVTIIFSMVGIFSIVYGFTKHRKLYYNFHPEYILLSIVFIGILLCTLLPHTWSTAPIRIYILSMILLSPLCVIGFIKYIKFIIIILILKFKLFNISNNIFNKELIDKSINYILLIIFSIYLFILILFNSGFFSELFLKDYSPNILIHKKRLIEKEIAEYEVDNRILTFYRWYFPEYDVLSAIWLSKMGKHEYKVYTQLAGLEDALVAYGSYKKGDQRFIHLPTVIKPIKLKEGYVYLRYLNYVQGIIITEYYPELKWYYFNLLNLDEKGDKIYCNGGSAIYHIGRSR